MIPQNVQESNEDEEEDLTEQELQHLQRTLQRTHRTKLKCRQAKCVLEMEIILERLEGAEGAELNLAKEHAEQHRRLLQFNEESMVQGRQEDCVETKEEMTNAIRNGKLQLEGMVVVVPVPSYRCNQVGIRPRDHE